MAAIPSGKRVHKTTNPVKEFKGFEIDPTTGFPICQKTKELIDGTKPYCKSCFIFGHSQKLFTGCEIHKDVLACLEKEEEEKTNGNKVDKKWTNKVIKKVIICCHFLLPPSSPHIVGKIW